MVKTVKLYGLVEITRLYYLLMQVFNAFGVLAAFMVGRYLIPTYDLQAPLTVLNYLDEIALFFGVYLVLETLVMLWLFHRRPAAGSP